MFFVILMLLLITFISIVSEPERWPTKLAEFLKNNHVHHG